MIMDDANMGLRVRHSVFDFETVDRQNGGCDGDNTFLGGWLRWWLPGWVTVVIWSNFFSSSGRF
jgi:hypothetical protein